LNYLFALMALYVIATELGTDTLFAVVIAMAAINAVDDFGFALGLTPAARLLRTLRRSSGLDPQQVRERTAQHRSP